MSSISVNDVKKLADLSAITLTDDQVEIMRNELSRILEYIDHLSEVDTTGAEPTFQVTGLQNVMREDEIIESKISTEQLLANAPMVEGGQIKVPRVLG